MEKAPVFSIIIPVYNTGEKIKKCLNCLVEQTYKDFEVILVNDGSKDNSAEIISTFFKSKEFSNYTLFTQTNAGAGSARNKGIQLSKGKYLAFIDSDDYIELDFLEKVYQKIAVEAADVIFIDIVRETEEGVLIRRENMSRFSSLNKDQLIRWQLTGKVPWGGCRKVVRACIIKDNDLHYAPIKVGEESIFSFRILDIAQIIAFQPLAIYHYVESDSSLTSNDNPHNSVEVFNFISKSLEELGKREQYLSTINAIAVSAVVVIINVITLDSKRKNKYKEAKQYLSYFNREIDGTIDVESLERRVQICIPFVKMGAPLPIMIASYLQKVIRKFK